MTATSPSTRDAIVAALLGPEVWPSIGRLNPDFKDHMHALGVFITSYNSLEFILFFFFYHYLGESRKTSVPLFIFSKLNNQNRIDALYVEIEPDPDVRERMKYFLDSYNICTENRNFLAHAQLHNKTSLGRLYGGDLVDVSRVIMKKPPRNAPERDNFTHLTVQEIHDMADDIGVVDDFGFKLFIFLEARHHGGVFTFPGGKTERPTLPDIPPVPRTLILSPTANPTTEKP